MVIGDCLECGWKHLNTNIIGHWLGCRNHQIVASELLCEVKELHFELSPFSVVLLATLVYLESILEFCGVEFGHFYLDRVIDTLKRAL